MTNIWNVFLLFFAPKNGVGGFWGVFGGFLGGFCKHVKTGRRVGIHELPKGKWGRTKIRTLRGAELMISLR